MEKLNDKLFKNLEKDKIGEMDKILGGKWYYSQGYSWNDVSGLYEISDWQRDGGGGSGGFAVGRYATA